MKKELFRFRFLVCRARKSRGDLLFFLTIVFAFFFSSIILPQPTYATATQSSLTITRTQHILNLNLQPESGGVFGKSGDNVISVSTDNYTGYTLSVRSDDSTSLINENDDEIESISSEISEATFSASSAYNNKWGLRPSQYITTNGNINTVVQNSNYLPAPSTSGQLLDITNVANITDNTYTISFGARIDYGITAGTYTYDYVIAAVANPIAYNITYDSNTIETVTGMPTPNPQTVTIDGGTAAADSYATLSDATPSLSGKRFGGWCDIATTVDSMTGDYICSGNTYAAGARLPIDQTAAPNITLYAIWLEGLADEYGITYHYGDITFTGANYLNTMLYPFSESSFSPANEIYQDFEINFTIDNYTPNSGQNSSRNTIVASQEEVSPNYVGFSFRYNTSGSRFEMESNSSSASSEMGTITHNPPSGMPWNVTIKRSGTELYFNNEQNPDRDYSNMTRNSTIPLTFGAATQNSNGAMYRYFKGTLSNITTELMYDTYSTVTLPSPTLTDRVFMGWSTTPDGSNIVDSVTIEGDVDLYAMWRPTTIDGYNVTYDYGNLSFDGTQYFNTNLKLFSAALSMNDFSITGGINNFQSLSGQDGNYNTIASNMDESGSPYPGFVYRYGTSSASAQNRGFNVAANSSNSNKASTYDAGITVDENAINIQRTNKKLYVENNELIDFSDFVKNFNMPLTFGATLNANNLPMRYLQADLDNVEVVVQYDKTYAVALPQPDYVNSGCTFLGWTGSNGNTPQLNVIIPAGNTTDKSYTANFRCSDILLRFEANGGESSEETRSLMSDEPIGPLPTAIRTGYTFGGWYYDNNTFNNPVSVNDTISSNTTVYAKWIINQYTITFNTDGGSPVAQITQDYGTAITPPANPTKTDYYFMGWSPAIPATMPAENITITAQWSSTPITDYNITLQYGNKTFNGNNYINTNLSLFSTDNFDFANHKYNDFSISLTVSNLASGNTDRATIVQDENEADSSNYPGFVFRYRTSGPVFNFTTYIQGSSDSAGSDISTSTPANVLIERKDNFMYFNNNKINKDLDGIPANFNNPLSFGAAFEHGNTSTPYRRFKGELQNINVTFEHENTTAITLPNPTLPNDVCVFSGWTGSNGSTPEMTVTIPAGNAQNKTYTANYNCSSSTVTLNPNGGTVSPSFIVVPPGQAIGSIPTPEKEGNTFNGWYIGSNFDTLVDATYTPTGDIDLYAKWTPNSYTLTFDSDGGSFVPDITQDYGTAITPPANPTKTGCTFVRWEPTLPATMPAENKTYTAIWRSDSISDYLVTLNYGALDFYTGSSYMNTGLQLFSNAIVHNDFAITTTVENSTFNSGQTGNFNSVFSIMDESGANSAYPGLVFRRNSSDFKFVANASAASSDKYDKNYNKSSILVSRVNDKLLLDSAQIIDLNNLIRTFNTPLTFGASLDSNGAPFRYFKGELSGTAVSIKYSNENSVAIPNPTFVNGDCTFAGWTGSNGNTPQTNITIPAENTADLTYTANFTCSDRIVMFDGNGGTVSEERRILEEDEAIGQLPTATNPNYIFNGWYDAKTGGNAITSSFVPSNRYTTVYAQWSKAASLAETSSNLYQLDLGNRSSTATITITNINELGETFTFASNNTSVATVDAQTGVITAVGVGETKVEIIGDTSGLKKTVDVVVSNDGVVVFNATPSAIRTYEDNIGSWANLSEANYVAAMKSNFESHECKMNSDSSIVWASGLVECDKPDGYDTGVNGAVDVYLYDTNNDTQGAQVSYTRSGSGLIYNMIPGQTYYWESQADSSVNGLVKALGNRRYIETGGIRNVRDLGGIPSTLGGSLKYGKLFRGERLRTNQSDVNTLIALGVTKEYLLSSTGEVSGDLTINTRENRQIVHYQIDPTVNLTNYNNARTVLVKVMEDVINGTGVYFHCVYGSDRTGTLAYLIEGLLGVSDEERNRDYELSGFFGEVDRHRYFSDDLKSGSNPKKFVYMKSYLPTIQSIIDWFSYNRTAAQQAEDAALIEDFREAMIEGYVKQTQQTIENTQSQNSAQNAANLLSNMSNVVTTEMSNHAGSDDIGASDENDSDVVVGSTAYEAYNSPLGVSENTNPVVNDNTGLLIATGVAATVAAVITSGYAVASASDKSYKDGGENETN